MESFPESPWSVLGLDGNTATERDIKKAYARLIKLHRPDTDPEEFRRIHDAYQMALVWRMNRDAATEESSDDSLEKRDVIESVEIAGNFESAKEVVLPPNNELSHADSAMAAAIERGDHKAMGDAMDLFRNGVAEKPELVSQWQASMVRLFPNDLPLLGHLMTPQDLQLMIDGDCEELPQPVMVEWHHRRVTQKLLELAARLLDKAADHESPVRAFAQARLSLLTSFANHRISERLANAVFPKLPPARRDHIMGEIDQRLSLGKVFSMLPQPTRLFFEARLFAGDETVDWSTPEAKRALNEVRARCPRDWPGFTILRQHLPAAIFRDLLQMYPIGSKPPALPNSTVQTRPAEKKAFSKTFIFIMIWMALIMVRNVTNCSQQQTKEQKFSNSQTLSEKLKGSGNEALRTALEKVARQDQRYLKNPDSSPQAKLDGEIKLESLISAVEKAAWLDVTFVKLELDENLPLKALRGEFPAFRTGSVKHLGLCIGMLTSPRASDNVRREAVEMLSQKFPPPILAEAILSIDPKTLATAALRGKVSILLKSASQILLGTSSEQLSVAQISGLEKIVNQ